MFTTEPGPKRSQLGFVEAVKSSFSFVDKYVLKLVQEEVTSIRYRSEQMTLNVSHGRGSYELGTEFKKTGCPERFSLYDMLKWAKAAGQSRQFRLVVIRLLREKMFKR